MNRSIKFILSLIDSLNTLRESPYHILLRARGMEVVGIVTKIELRYDPSWGVMRPWAKGLTLTGNKFEEPLDRKNRRTGELEDLVQMKNDLIIITARNTHSPDDDNDDNFQYMLNPHVSNDIKDKLDAVKEKNRILNDLNKRLAEATNKANMYYNMAESANSELNVLREKVRTLSERLAEQTQRAEDYKRQLKEMQIGMLREESKLDEKLRSTDKLGKLEGKDSADIVLEAAKKQAEARMELDKLGMGGLTAYATKTDIDRLKEDILNSLKVKTESKEENKQSGGDRQSSQ